MTISRDIDFSDPQKIDERVIEDKEKFAEIASGSQICEKDGTSQERLLLLEIDSLNQYIKYIEQLGECTRHCRPMIFRGHSQITYELMPSIMRKDIFASPPTAPQIDEYEDHLMDEWRKRARAFVEPTARENRLHWECLARAQHHYLPTRLLDWTERAATALYFAVERDKKSDFSCVWAIFAPEAIRSGRFSHPNQIDKVYLFRPPHIVPRITVQQSCFTVHPSDYRQRPHDWIKGMHFVFVVRNRHRQKILKGLHAVGINRAALFPDLDGVAAHLRETIRPKRKT